MFAQRSQCSLGRRATYHWLRAIMVLLGVTALMGCDDSEGYYVSYSDGYWGSWDYHYTYDTDDDWWCWPFCD